MYEQGTTEYNGFKIDINIKDRIFEPGQLVKIFYIFAKPRTAKVIAMERDGWMLVREGSEKHGALYQVAVGMAAPHRRRTQAA